MIRWTTVSALLLLACGASYGAWHLLLPGGPASEHDALLASPRDPAASDASSEAPLTVRREDTAGGSGAEEPRGGALIARWEEGAARQRAAVSRRVDKLATTPHWNNARERYDAVRRSGEHAHNLAQLKGILHDTTDPMVRQNLIFLAVLTLPSATSHPWLLALEGGADPADAEDALVALAFDGEGGSVGRFESLARTPSKALVHRLYDDGRGYARILAGGPAATRDILRSYRAIEVLDRKLYFKRARNARPASWVDHPHAGNAALVRRLEEAWLSRYPKHPGSDDIAWRIGRSHTQAGHHLEACRWYSLASVVPDQDMTYPALRDLLLTCELLLAPEDVWRIAPDALDPNFDLLDYVAMRRVAVSRGFEAALDHARMRATGEPGSLVGHAWRVRRSQAIPRGVHSGEVRLPADDPLLTMGRWLPRPARVDSGTDSLTQLYWRNRYGGLSEGDRLRPPRLALAPESHTVARQLRAWETMAALARRERDARGPAQADLLYKQAAIAYHDGLLLFPRWDSANSGFGSQLRGPALRRLLDAPEDIDRGRERFERESFAPYLAIALLERLEQEHPDYPGMDKVLFSKGMAWKRLIDFWPFDSVGVAYPWVSREERMDGAVRSLVRCFEDLAARYPDSSLTDDALAAAAYWRRERRGAFGG